MTVHNGQHDVSVTQVELTHGISAGIRLRVQVPGMVPIDEEHEARLERGIGLETWSSIDVMEKALIIAIRRVRIAKQNLQAEAEIEKARRNANKK